MKCLLSILILLTCFSAFAQTFTLRGTNWNWQGTAVAALILLGTAVLFRGIVSNLSTRSIQDGEKSMEWFVEQ